MTSDTVEFDSKTPGWTRTQVSSLALVNGALHPVHRWINVKSVGLALSVAGQWLWWRKAAEGHDRVAITGSEGAESGDDVRNWPPFGQIPVPATGGGWWLVDQTGSFIQLNEHAERIDAPGFFSRLGRVLSGRSKQPTARASASPDGVLDSWVDDSRRQMATLWLLLFAPFLVVALAWRWAMLWQLGGLAYLVANAGLARVLVEEVLPLL